MDIKRSLTTVYHSQADRQTEIMNQYLEIALRTYIGPDLNDWDEYLDGIALSSNTMPNSITKFAPAFLLYGFDPVTHATLSGSSETAISCIENSKKFQNPDFITHDSAANMLEEFNAHQTRAKEALSLAQAVQARYYNKGQLDKQFEEGNFVLLNPHSLRLFHNKKG